MTIEAQITRLEKELEDFCRSASSLDERRFLRPIRQWSPRDIVAHLVGWNGYLIQGADQIRRGELPFYDIDPGDNYSNVNAALVRKYSSTSREELLNELRASAGELQQYLRSLDTESSPFLVETIHGSRLFKQLSFSAYLVSYPQS